METVSASPYFFEGNEGTTLTYVYQDRQMSARFPLKMSPADATLHIEKLRRLTPYREDFSR